MKVSCICLTYGRTALLEEAVESFLRQTYDDRELIIFNTLTNQKLQFDHPQVKIVNSLVRPSTIGETRNLAIEACSGELLLTFDDDDIFLPHYISWLVERVQGDWVRQGSKFTFKAGKTMYVGGQANGQFMFSKAAWLAVGGYPRIDSGEDCEFHKLLKATRAGRNVPCQPSEIGFIYRFGQGRYNLSAFGRNQPGKPTGLQSCARKLAKGGVPHGTVKLNPHWRNDYWGITRKWLSENGHAS